MVEHEEASMMEKIKDKLHCDSSSSDSDNGKSERAPAESVEARIYRLFGRERPVHEVPGAGKPADIFLWRNKRISAGVLAGATAIWVFFELMEYHLLTLVCHCLILSLTILFLWSNAAIFIHKSPLHIPEATTPEDLAVDIALSLRYEINRGFANLRDIASGQDLKKFLAVIACLWVLSILGSCCNFMTLFYIVFVILHTVPVLYEKYEDKVDPFAEKVTTEFKKHYDVFCANIVGKIPKTTLKNKKH